MVFQRDDLGRVVCSIRTPRGTSEEVGTAIFVSKDNTAFLLTASHVVKDLTDQSYAVLSDDQGVPQKVQLSILLGGNQFDHHPQADLAKAKIALSTTNQGYLKGRCFPFNQIETNSVSLSKDIELTTIGFPLGLGASGSKFSPLSFRTFVAAPMITLARFDNAKPCDFIILELPSVGGYSGGPLFDLGYVIHGGMTTMKDKTLLHGIVHGTITDKTGGKLAAITPCKYLAGWI